MTLGNMRANGVRSLAVFCGGRFCDHSAIFDVSGYPDDLPVPAFRPRMVCTVCGAIGADARPNWNERAPTCLFSANANQNALSGVQRTLRRLAAMSAYDRFC
jgi:hypothetical protein